MLYNFPPRKIQIVFHITLMCSVVSGSILNIFVFYHEHQFFFSSQFTKCQYLSIHLPIRNVCHFLLRHGGVLAQHALIGAWRKEQPFLYVSRNFFSSSIPCVNHLMSRIWVRRGRIWPTDANSKGTRDSSAAASGNLHPDLGLASFGVKA